MRDFRKGILPVLAFAAATALSLQGAALAAESPTGRVFKAGAATSNITPFLGGRIVGGWDAPAATQVHDELHARCLVLDDGSERIAIVLVDSVGVAREVFDDAKRQVFQATGLAPDHVLAAATHTHSATSSTFDNPLKPDGRLSEYQAFVARRIADGVRRAINNLEPARIGWGTADEPRHVFNRRWLMKPGEPMNNPFGGTDRARMNPEIGSPNLLEPAGPVDPQICFFSVQSASGRPIALLANYSLHYVGGIGPTEISADYFAAFADRIQQLIGADRLDPPFVGILSNGTSGNVNNLNFRGTPEKRAPYQQIRSVADCVAQDVFREYGKLSYRDWVPLRMMQRQVELLVRKPSPAQLARARELMAGAEPKSDRPHEKTYAARLLAQQEAPSTIAIPLQAIRIGDLGIAAIPFETFSETGLELKARNPFKPAFTIELANGSYGYLPTPEQHALGGYETCLAATRSRSTRRPSL
jgi:neutral ceramidase